MTDQLHTNATVIPTNPGRATIINNCIEDIYNPNNGAFNVDIMHESKVLPGDRPNIRATKLARIRNQLESADTNIRWLLENYLIDEYNNFVIRAHNCIDSYNTTDVRLLDIYQILNSNTGNLQKIPKNQIPLDDYCRLETRPNYSQYMTQFDLTLYQRIVLVDFRNIYCGVAGMESQIVEGLRNACDRSQDTVDYSDDNIQIFENYLYNQIAYRDPNTLYIVIKSNNGSRTRHGFAALTRNVIEYTLNLEKGAHAEGITFVEYDDYTLMGLYIILSRFYIHQYNIQLSILSGDKYNWYTPINIDAHAPQRTYVQLNTYYELRYYSPRSRKVLFSQVPALTNRYEPPRVVHAANPQGSLRDLFTLNNFISSSEIMESDRLYTEYQSTIEKINDAIAKYLHNKQIIRNTNIRKINNNSIQTDDILIEQTQQLLDYYTNLEDYKTRLQTEIGQLGDLSLLEFAQQLDQSIVNIPGLLQNNRNTNTRHANNIRRIREERVASLNKLINDAQKLHNAALPEMKKIKYNFNIYSTHINTLKSKLPDSQADINKHSRRILDIISPIIETIRNSLKIITETKTDIERSNRNNETNRRIQKYFTETTRMLEDALVIETTILGNIIDRAVKRENIKDKAVKRKSSKNGPKNGRNNGRNNGNGPYTKKASINQNK